MQGLLKTFSECLARDLWSHYEKREVEAEGCHHEEAKEHTFSFHLVQNSVQGKADAAEIHDRQENRRKRPLIKLACIILEHIFFHGPQRVNIQAEYVGDGDHPNHPKNSTMILKHIFDCHYFALLVWYAAQMKMICMKRNKVGNIPIKYTVTVTE